MDELLKKFGLTIDDLNGLESDQFYTMLEDLQNNRLTLEKFKDYVTAMKSAVEEELSNEPEYIQVFIFRFRNDKNIFLKARIRNYMIMEAFLTSPEKAKQAIERSLANVVKKIGEK